MHSNPLLRVLAVVGRRRRPARAVPRPCPRLVQPDDRALDLEFAFTTWQESCRDPYPTLQQCRRRAGHEGQHAAGFGVGRNRWDR